MKRSSTMELRSLSKRQRSDELPATSSPSLRASTSRSKRSLGPSPTARPSKRTTTSRSQGSLDASHAASPSKRAASSRSRKASSGSTKKSTESHTAKSLDTRRTFAVPPSPPTMSRARSESTAATSHRMMTPDTPYKSNTASIISTTDQVYHTTASVNVTPTLSKAVDQDTLEHNAKMRGKPIFREEMEKLLRAEIHGAVYLCSNFCEEKLAASDTKLRRAMSRLASDPFFQYADPKSKGKKRKGLSVDLTGFGESESDMYKTVVKLLNLINTAAFTRNHFRPKLRPIVDEHARKMWADDVHDSETSPDLVQADPADHDGENQGFHWMDVEFFCECKKSPGQLGEALLQLARYARATYGHQLYRDHIYSLAICGKEATFVLFDRAKITHSAPINLETDLKKFIEAAIGLFSLDAKAFGYDTRFSWSPAPTGEPGDHEVVRELRFYHNNADWQVLEVLCQRKCLLGRATTVLRVGNVHDPDDCRATKLIWRPVTRPHEADTLRSFDGDEGVVRCLWSDKGRLTTLEGLTLLNSPYQKHFFPGISASEFHSISEKMPEPSESKGRNIHKMGTSEARKQRPFHLEERQKDVMQMAEGTALWRIKRLLHLLIVLRDAIVGYAHVVKKGKIHRDISIGNVLCDILKDPRKTKKTGPAANLRSRRSCVQAQEDDYEFISAYEFPIENQLSDVESLEDYVLKRYKSAKPRMSIGKLSDFEFAVDAFRPGDVARGQQRTGTWTFISARLLTLHQARVAIPHTYLDDLESFFWVFFWVVINHTEQGQHRNDKARDLAARLTISDPARLGDAKKVLLMQGGSEEVKDVYNVWSDDAVDPIMEFADILENEIYTRGAKGRLTEIFTNPEEKSQPDPWIVLKSVIDVFDRHIARLQCRDQRMNSS